MNTTLVFLTPCTYLIYPSYGQRDTEIKPLLRTFKCLKLLLFIHLLFLNSASECFRLTNLAIPLLPYPCCFLRVKVWDSPQYLLDLLLHQSLYRYLLLYFLDHDQECCLVSLIFLCCFCGYTASLLPVFFSK